MMRTRLLTTCIGIIVGTSSLLANTPAMSAAVNANDNEYGYGLSFVAPFDGMPQGSMPTTINTWLEANNLGENGDHIPDLPDQVPNDAPNDVPRNIPDIPDNGSGPSAGGSDGIGMELHDLLNTDEPVAEGWQEEHQIGLYNEAAGSLDLTTTSEPSTITSSSLITVSAVPVPAAVWLFGSGLLGLIGVAKRKKA